eukprot:jgi/Ulvmu1/1910/UM012_0069.1
MWRLTTCYDSGGHPFLQSTNGHQGRQVWVYEEDAGTDADREKVEGLREAFTKTRLTQKHSSDELLRLQKIDRSKIIQPPSPPPKGATPEPDGVKAHLDAGMQFHSMLQMDDGHFPGDYGGPMFLLPGLLIACYVTGCLDKVFSPAHKREVLRYLRNHQNEDGGFGLHIEGSSTMFGTGLCYVSMRLLGVDAEDPSTARARSWILARGDVTYITSWGKFWLAVLGCFSWDGMNPITPEMWLLPYSAWTGIGWAHPGRYWCHCRMVYLPMSYLYGIRATGTVTPLVEALRQELFDRDYGSVDWNAARNRCASEDLYYPHPWVQDALWWVLYKAENVLLGSALRRAALREVMKLVHYEDENTRYIDIGPVNKALNLVCCWFEDPEGEPFKRHLARVPDYLWVAEDGLKMQGYNGSQLWDTAFTAQAFAATGVLSPVVRQTLTRAHAYIRNSQVVTEAAAPLERYYRHISVGAWPFSTRDHGWPISDCTSEGLKASLALAALPAADVGDPLPDTAFFDAVNVIFSYQNANGGWPTYELQRSFAAIEVLNPAETFGDIMVDYSYVECSSACMTALCAFRKRFPDHRAGEVTAALRRGRAFIESIQRADGSWYGSWAVCFTYGCWFGAKALRALGETVETCEAQRKVAAFLTQRQRADGGWGESYLSCQDKVYTHLSRESHVVNTGWAMLALMAAGAHETDPAPLHRGAAFLMRAQLPDGDWPQQHISGVFNRNCMITYANYRNTFPIWALGVYRRCVLLREPYATGM